MPGQDGATVPLCADVQHTQEAVVLRHFLDQVNLVKWYDILRDAGVCTKSDLASIV
eukprot:gene35565-31136_t